MDEIEFEALKSEIVSNHAAELEQMRNKEIDLNGDMVLSSDELAHSLAFGLTCESAAQKLEEFTPPQDVPTDHFDKEIVDRRANYFIDQFGASEAQGAELVQLENDLVRDSGYRWEGDPSPQNIRDHLGEKINSCKSLS